MGMRANVKKSVVMRVNPRNPASREADPLPSETFQWGGEPVPQVPSYTYLGIEMQDNLQWNMQVDKIINKIRFAYHRVQPMLRDDNVPCYIKMRLVNAIICPLAMYGAEAWSPSADQMRAIVSSMGKIYRRVASCPKRVVSEIIDKILMVNRPEREYIYLRRLFHRFSRFCNLEGVHNHMVDIACHKAELIGNPNRCTTSYQRFYEIINDGNTFETKHQLKV